MPHIKVNGANIYYEEQGTGAETIVFSHGLLWSGQLYENQVAALKSHYRCITFDFRGQGRSEATESGYDMDTLAEDAAALIKALNCAPCHFAGLSMGGFVGMRVAFRHPELLKSLILLATSADAEVKEKLGRYKLLNLVARCFGLGVVSSQVMPIMFGKKFLTDPLRKELKREFKSRIASNHRIGITKAIKGVIEREGVFEEIKKIKAPTLVIVGDQDVATVPSKSERIHSQIEGSKLILIPGAGHSATLEEPEAVNKAISDFLSSQK
ncbi:MAG: alpha/beta fold hydrolase [Acidobacteria bacterium]|nr:alpha/beta fold hydrolase [Acidobacteriota bacterium]